MSVSVTLFEVSALCLHAQLNFDLDRGVFPLVVQAVVDDGDGKPQVHQYRKLLVTKCYS